MAKKKPLTEKKLKAVLTNENQHLIGVEMKSTIDDMQMTFSPTLENVGIQDGVLALTLTTLPKNRSEEETFRDVLGVYDVAHIGLSFMEVDAPVVKPMASLVFEQEEGRKVQKLITLIDVDDSAWFKEYTIAGVKTTELYLLQQDTGGMYYIRLLFSEEDNLHGLSSYINKKLDKAQTSWLVENVLTNIFGATLDLIYLEQESSGVSLMIATPMGLGGTKATALVHEETRELQELFLASPEGLATGTVSLAGYRAQMRESNGVYAILLTKQVSQDKEDKITLFIR